MAWLRRRDYTVRENRESEENGEIAINAEIAEQKNHSAISALASVSACSQLD